MRTVTLIRHAHSTANAAKEPASMSAQDLAFANRSAGLTPDKGVNQCLALAPELPQKYQINPPETPVATSTYERTKLTAVRLGFITVQAYPELDEVERTMDLETLREQLRRNEIPDIAVTAGQAALEQAPDEDVWVTHGLLIAGICTSLGIAGQYERPVPLQCEVRQITF